jgi:hypothetical protein
MSIGYLIDAAYFVVTKVGRRQTVARSVILNLNNFRALLEFNPCFALHHRDTIGPKKLR